MIDSLCGDSTLSNVCVSRPTEVSAVDDSKVNHPLFGKIDRVLVGQSLR